MKSTLKTIFASILAVAAAACTRPSIDELSGKYAAPTELAVAGASATVTAEPAGDFTYITVKIGSGFDVKFASKKYYLVPTIYYLNPEQGIKAGMYLEGASKVNGKAITFGSINVDATALDEDETRFECHIYSTVQTGENERTKFDWTGILEFEKPEVAEADYIFTETLGEAADEKGVVTPGAVKHTITLFKDNAPAGGLELITAAGAGIVGHYDVMSYANVPGKAGNGYYMDLSSWGMGIISGGSYLIVDGQFVAVEAGQSIDVSIDPATGYYNVTTSNGFEYTMDQYVETLAMTMTNNPDSVTDETNTPVAGFDRWDIQLKKGDTLVAAFDLVVTAGSDIAGVYNVAGYPHADHIAGNGWGMAAWNFFGGSRFADGSNWIYVNPGSQIMVTANPDGSYTFTGIDANLQSSVDGSQPYTGSFKFKGLAQ